MADKHITIGRVINLTGMIGVSAGIVLLAFGLVARISAWFWLRYCKPLSLVLVAGGVDCFAH